MAALAKDRKLNTRGVIKSRPNRRGVKGGVVIYNGGAVCKDALGYLVPASDTAGLVMVGVATETVDNTLGASGAKTCNYDTGIEVEFDNAAGAVTLAHLGRGCYFVDDQSVTTRQGSVNKVFAGTVTEFTALKCWVVVDEAILGVLGDARVAPVQAAAALPASGLSIVERFVIPNAATGDYDVVVPERIQVLDVLVQKTDAGAGANANTVQVKNAAAVISDAISINAANQGDLKRAANITQANATINANGTLRISITRAGGDAAVEVTVFAVKK